MPIPPLCRLSDSFPALHCSCKAVGTTQKQLTVRQLPPVLCLHLKRFEVVAQAGAKTQVSGAHGAIAGTKAQVTGAHGAPCRQHEAQVCGARGAIAQPSLTPDAPGKAWLDVNSKAQVSSNGLAAPIGAEQLAEHETIRGAVNGAVLPRQIVTSVQHHCILLQGGR